MNRTNACQKNCCGPCNNDNNYDITKRLSDNKYYNLNKESEKQVSKLANKLMSQISKNQLEEEGIKPLDNSYDCCAFGLSSNRTRYNKASGQSYNE